MAANVEDAASADSEAYIEKYLRSVLAVENILTLDRLRQVCFSGCSRQQRMCLLGTACGKANVLRFPQGRFWIGY